MIPPSKQHEVLDRISRAAKSLDLIVAPVGSVYFLYRGEKTLLTKDVDAVILTSDLEPASMKDLEDLAQALGDGVPAADRASVSVSLMDSEGTIEVDLLRGKQGASKGFFPRALLKEAAERGSLTGNLLWFPIEYSIVLKADAAVDRRRRARTENPHQEENKNRAMAFAADVFTQTQAAQRRLGLQEDFFRDALRHVKAARRAEIADLLEAASSGQIKSVGLMKGE